MSHGPFRRRGASGKPPRAAVFLWAGVLLLLAGCAVSPGGTIAPTVATPGPEENRFPTLMATTAPTVSPPVTPPVVGTATPSAPASSWLPALGGLITHGARDRPYVALTFDMCQKPSKPARFDYGILKVLIANQAPATFFLGGDWVRTHPKEASLLADNALFELGNHSWSHPDMRTLDAHGIAQEITKTQEILHQLTGKPNRLFRLPYGWYNDAVLKAIASLGLYTIQWDVVTADPALTQTADKIEAIVKEHAQNGSIIIMHANGRGWHTAEALPWIIQYLRGQGYTLVTVSQLLGFAPLPPTKAPASGP